MYLVSWNVHQFFRDPLHLFDANILYPARGALALTDHRLLPSLLVAPVLWLSGNAVLAYNVALALAALLAAGAARHLGRRLGLDAVGAWTAGALYAFHTYQINEAPRLHVVFHGFIPLALLQLVCYLRTGRRSAAIWTAVLMLLQGLASNYHLLYGTLLLGIVLALALVLNTRATLARLPVLALAASLAALAFSPIAVHYLRAAEAPAYHRELPAGVDLSHYLATTPTNLLYGPIGAKVRLQQQGPHFVGFFGLGLAGLSLAAWAKGRGDQSPVASPLLPRWWIPVAAGLALLLMVLSLGRDLRAFGHDLGPGPYRLLYDFVPGFRLVRIPERLSLLAMLFVALLAGEAVTRLRGWRLRTLALLGAALVPLEHVSPPPHRDRIPVGDQVPAVYRWLAQQPVRALAELPVHGDLLVRKETLEMYYSTYHWKPIIHGYTGYPPPESQALRRSAESLPRERGALAALRRAGVDTLLLHLPPEPLLERYREIPGRAREAFARHFGLERLEFYTGFERCEQEGLLRRLAQFQGPTARLPGGTDVVYAIAGP